MRPYGCVGDRMRLSIALQVELETGMLAVGPSGSYVCVAHERNHGVQALVTMQGFLPANEVYLKVPTFRAN